MGRARWTLPQRRSGRWLMNGITTIFHSTIGKKYLMAITGLLLVLFVIGHMLGNLQIFLGPETINAYGAFLKGRPVLLWSARSGLLAAAAVHVWAAATLAARNRAARPTFYRVKRFAGASYASRTMIWSGLIVLAFIVYHLLHFTVGVVDPALLQLRDEAQRHDIYRMVILGFSHPLVSGFYILSMALLCAHLRHGSSSLLQSLGFRAGWQRVWADRLASVLAWGVFVGNSSIPLAILLGYGKEALKQ